MKTYIPGILTLAIDFDGTITTETHLGHELQLRESADFVIPALHDTGKVKMILWTCRSGTALQQAVQFLRVKGLLPYFSAINDNLPEIAAKYAPDVSRKIGADLYIDDRNFYAGPEGEVDWMEIYDMLTGGVLNDLNR